MNIAMIVLWGALIILTVILEIATEQFVSIWFSCAAVVSLVISILGAPVWAQFLVFLCMTAILLILTRPIVRKLRGAPVRTNADMNVGMTAIVTENIENSRSTGRATVGGVSWKAVSEDGSVIQAGDSVIIRAVDGAKLIVAKNEAARG